LTVDLNHKSGYVPGQTRPTVSLGEAINTLIDFALVEARRRALKREYLGASVLGDPCARRLAFQYRGERGEPLDGRVLRIFGQGRVLEDLLADWIRNAGFKLHTVAPGTSEQWSFRDGPIEGHIDGIILNGPEIGLPYPLLWEAKSLNDRSWSDLVKHGLQVSKPPYYGQVNLYMRYFGYPACLLSALNKNTAEIYHEVITFDRAEAQRLVDRAVAIARGWMPPRIAAEPVWHCNYCAYRTLCWSSEHCPTSS